jgi:hypothetical protein
MCCNLAQNALSLFEEVVSFEGVTILLNPVRTSHNASYDTARIAFSKVKVKPILGRMGSSLDVGQFAEVLSQGNRQRNDLLSFTMISATPGGNPENIISLFLKGVYKRGIQENFSQTT